MIARWPGRIPAGLVNDAVAASVDILPTFLKAAGVAVPRDRKIDGEDLWSVLTSADAESPHEAVFGMQGPNLATVRSGRWRLHVRSPGLPAKRGDDWVDPRGPDGVMLLAPYEQARPSAYPGVRGSASRRSTTGRWPRSPSSSVPRASRAGATSRAASSSTTSRFAEFFGCAGAHKGSAVSRGYGP